MHSKMNFLKCHVIIWNVHNVFFYLILNIPKKKFTLFQPKIKINTVWETLKKKQTNKHKKQKQKKQTNKQKTCQKSMGWIVYHLPTPLVQFIDQQS